MSLLWELDDDNKIIQMTINGQVVSGTKEKLKDLYVQANILGNINRDITFKTRKKYMSCTCPECGEPLTDRPIHSDCQKKITQRLIIKHLMLGNSNCAWCHEPITEGDRDWHHLDPDLKWRGIADLDQVFSPSLINEIEKCIPLHIKCHRIVDKLFDSKVAQAYHDFWLPIVNESPYYKRMDDDLPRLSPLNPMYSTFFIEEFKRTRNRDKSTMTIRKKDKYKSITNRLNKIPKSYWVTFSPYEIKILNTIIEK